MFTKERLFKNNGLKQISRIEGKNKAPNKGAVETK